MKNGADPGGGSGISFKKEKKVLLLQTVKVF